MTYRKIGGIHWLAIGKLRISWCFVKPKRRPVLKPMRLPKVTEFDNFLRELEATKHH